MLKLFLAQCLVLLQWTERLFFFLVLFSRRFVQCQYSSRYCGLDSHSCLRSMMGLLDLEHSSAISLFALDRLLLYALEQK